MKKTIIFIIAALFFLAAVYAPAFAADNISGPTVYGNNGHPIDIDSEIADPQIWADARSNINPEDDEHIVGVYKVTVDTPGYTGGGTVSFICQSYTDAEIYRYDGGWKHLPTAFNSQTGAASAYSSVLTTYFALAVGHTETHAPITASGITVSDSIGKIQAADVIAMTNTANVNMAAAAIGVLPNQTIKLYDITHMSGHAPYTINVNVPAGGSGLSVYTLSNSRWNKIATGNTSATLQLPDDGVIAVVYTPYSASSQVVNPTAGVKISLPAGTVYYECSYWGNGIPFPNLQSPVTLQKDKIVIGGPSYSNGYNSFYMGDVQYFIPTGAVGATSPQQVAAQQVVSQPVVSQPVVSQPVVVSTAPVAVPVQQTSHTPTTVTSYGAVYS